jgi:hypothetical protein
MDIAQNKKIINDYVKRVFIRSGFSVGYIVASLGMSGKAYRAFRIDEVVFPRRLLRKLVDIFEIDPEELIYLSSLYVNKESFYGILVPCWYKDTKGNEEIIPMVLNLRNITLFYQKGDRGIIQLLGKNVVETPESAASIKKGIATVLCSGSFFIDITDGKCEVLGYSQLSEKGV